LPSDYSDYCDCIWFRVDPSARLAPRRYRSTSREYHSETLCFTVVEEAVVKESKEMLDILSEYTDVYARVNLNKLAKWMKADNEEEFKKNLPSLPLELVSETNPQYLSVSQYSQYSQ
jgi:hypothetical protein